MSYLAQSRLPDGNALTPLRAEDPITYRRFDFGHYQASDSFLTSSSSAITTWSYMPFGAPSDPGDGGEQYARTTPDTVAITETKDGGHPDNTVFPGPDHWVVFRTDATESRKCLVALIGGSPAYTCYWRAVVNFPGIPAAVDTIISEHYSYWSPVLSSAMERFFLGKGWGRLAWQSWNNQALPTRENVDARCPDFGYNVPPQPGWVLNDCRIATNIEGAPGTLTGAQEWHP